MNPPIFVLRRAENDLDEIADYIARDNPRAAIRFYCSAWEDFTKLAAMPGMGARRRVRNISLKALRSWSISGFRKYLIFYQPLASGGIEVIRVLHGARQVEQILKQTPD